MASHLVGDGHLEVQRPPAAPGDHGQRVDVGVGDVAAILAQVGGDAVGAGGQGHLGGADGIGIALAARVPHGGDVVDVDA